MESSPPSLSLGIGFDVESAGDGGKGSGKVDGGGSSGGDGSGSSTGDCGGGGAGCGNDGGGAGAGGTGIMGVARTVTPNTVDAAEAVASESAALAVTAWASAASVTWTTNVRRTLAGVTCTDTADSATPKVVAILATRFACLASS